MVKRLRRLPVHLILWVIFSVLLFPAAVMVSTSLKTFEDIFSWPPTWIPENVQWENYIRVWFGEYHFSRPFFNSVFISSVTSLITILLAFPAAYALSRFSFRGRESMLFIMLMTQMFSPVVLIVGLYQLIQKYDLLNTYTGVIVTNCAFTVPMAIWLMQGYLKNIPVDLEQAAHVDGCSRLSGIVRIVLPLSAPGVAMIAIYSFIFAWNELLIPLVFISEADLRPASLALTDFVAQNVVYWHEMMAASVLTTLPIALMFSFVQKFFIQGLMSGAIKE